MKTIGKKILELEDAGVIKTKMTRLPKKEKHIKAWVRTYYLAPEYKDTILKLTKKTKQRKTAGYLGVYSDKNRPKLYIKVPKKRGK